MCSLYYYDMSKASITPDISDILQLVESIPINDKLEIEIDAKVHLNDQNVGIAERVGINKRTISFRDIVNLLVQFIKGTSLNDTITLGAGLNELQKIGCTYSEQYLLFDFCLAALEEDYLNAKLFLGHAIQILGLSNQINLLLSAIIYTPLTSDKDVRELLTLLALAVQPANAESFIELYGEEFEKRYQIYQNELMKLK